MNHFNVVHRISIGHIRLKLKHSFKRWRRWTSKQLVQSGIGTINNSSDAFGDIFHKTFVVCRQNPIPRVPCVLSIIFTGWYNSSCFYPYHVSKMMARFWMCIKQRTFWHLWDYFHSVSRIVFAPWTGNRSLGNVTWSTIEILKDGWIWIWCRKTSEIIPRNWLISIKSDGRKLKNAIVIRNKMVFIPQPILNWSRPGEVRQRTNSSIFLAHIFIHSPIDKIVEAVINLHPWRSWKKK